MPVSAARVFTEVKHAHEQIYTALKALKSLAAQSGSITELANIAHAINQSQKLTADTDKDIRMFLETVKKALCVLWVQSDLSGEPAPIKTDYVTATPSVKMVLSVPSRKTDFASYAKLMTHLGVPQHLWDMPEGQSVVADVHYPGFVDYVSSLVEQGAPLPPGCDPAKLSPVYKVVLNSRKEVLA
jgi:hypothetical protein